MKKLLKSLIIFTLVLFTCFSFAGCDNTNNGGDVPPSTEQGYINNLKSSIEKYDEADEYSGAWSWEKTLVSKVNIDIDTLTFVGNDFWTDELKDIARNTFMNSDINIGVFSDHISFDTNNALGYYVSSSKLSSDTNITKNDLTNADIKAFKVLSLDDDNCYRYYDKLSNNIKDVYLVDDMYTSKFAELLVEKLAEVTNLIKDSSVDSFKSKVVELAQNIIVVTIDNPEVSIDFSQKDNVSTLTAQVPYVSINNSAAENLNGTYTISINFDNNGLIGYSISVVYTSTAIMPFEPSKGAYATIFQDVNYLHTVELKKSYDATHCPTFDSSCSKDSFTDKGGVTSKIKYYVDGIYFGETSYTCGETLNLKSLTGYNKWCIDKECTYRFFRTSISTDIDLYLDFSCFDYIAIVLEGDSDLYEKMNMLYSYMEENGLTLKDEIDDLEEFIKINKGNLVIFSDCSDFEDIYPNSDIYVNNISIADLPQSSVAEAFVSDRLNLVLIIR